MQHIPSVFFFLFFFRFFFYYIFLFPPSWSSWSSSFNGGGGMGVFSISIEWLVQHHTSTQPKEKSQERIRTRKNWRCHISLSSLTWHWFIQPWTESNWPSLLIASALLLLLLLHGRYQPCLGDKNVCCRTRTWKLITTFQRVGQEWKQETRYWLYDDDDDERTRLSPRWCVSVCVCMPPDLFDTQPSTTRNESFFLFKLKSRSQIDSRQIKNE